MNRLEHQIERDLRRIADRATPSPDAWNSILTRIAEQDPDTETEIIIRTEATPTSTRRWLPIASAAAVAVLVVAGLALLISNTSSDDDQNPPPAAATTVAPTTVAPRTETGSFSGDDGVPVTFTVPEGWLQLQGMFVFNVEACCPRRGPGPAVAFLEVTNIYPEGCLVGPPVGPTVDDLVSALANVPGLNATAAVDVTVDGYAGKQIEFTVPDYNEDECRGNPYALWYGPGDAAPPRFEEFIGQTFDPGIPNVNNKLWILDVGGTRVVIHAYSYPGIFPQDQADLDEILASIQIG